LVHPKGEPNLHLVLWNSLYFNSQSCFREYFGSYSW